MLRAVQNRNSGSKLRGSITSKAVEIMALYSPRIHGKIVILTAGKKETYHYVYRPGCQ